MIENTRLTREEEGAMLKQIWEELRFTRTEVKEVREKLDEHVDRNNSDFKKIESQVSEVKTEISGHRLKLGLMFSAIGLALAGVVSWLVNHTDRLS